MAYCTSDDLLVGDMVFGSLDVTDFINQAANEIDSKLGVIYKLPLSAAVGQTFVNLPQYQQLIVKNINIKLASGRLFLTTAADDTSSLHQYGMRLVQEAMSELMAIANGLVELSAERREPIGQEQDRIPRTLNHDEESMVDQYEKLVHRGENVYTLPGELP